MRTVAVCLACTMMLTPPSISAQKPPAKADPALAANAGAGKNVPAKPDPAKKPAKPKPEPTPPTGSYLQDVCSFTTLRCLRTNPPGLAATPLPEPPLGALAADMGPCQSLLADSEKVIRSTDVNKLLGNIPKPFSTLPVGPYLYIYSSDLTLTGAEKTLLDTIEGQIGAVVAASTSFELELAIPHAATLTNIGASLQAAAPPGLTVTATSAASVRIVLDGSVDCAALKGFLKYTSRFAYHVSSDTPVASVFYLDPAGAGAAVGGKAVPYAAGGAAALSSVSIPAAPGSGAGNTGGGNKGSGDGGASGGGGSGKSAGSAPGGTSSGGSSGGGSQKAAASSGQASGQTITVTTSSAPAAAAKTPAGPATGNPATVTSISASAPAGASNESKDAAPSEPDAPRTPAPPSSEPTFSVNGRDLYFTGGTPGDDGWITEKKRALALLDLPQPQVLVNAWVMQSSTTRAQHSGQLTNLLHEVVNSFNDTIQLSLYLGWSKLRSDSKGAEFFNKDFYNYLTLRTVLDSRAAGDGVNSDQDVVRGVAGKRVDDGNTVDGSCGKNEYCLGYTTLFNPTQPRLTDMLLALIAANKPSDEADLAIKEVECGKNTLLSSMVNTECDTEGKQVQTEISGESNCDPNSAHCKAAETHDTTQLENVLLESKKGWSLGGCQEMDEHKLLERERRHPEDQRLPLECFRMAMHMLGNDAAGNSSTVGLVRAALADFLFNYKLSQEYPHEFAPYDLTASAQALDAALSPFIHAFNEDLQAFQTFVRARFVVGTSSMKLSGDKNTFLNDGIITVQTTSGDIASVATGTQSFLNTSKAPSISQLLSGVAGTKSGGQTGGPLSGVLSNLSMNEAQVLLGALSAYQTTTLNVGRQLNLVVKPRSLLGASAAEMDVQLNADQAPNSPNYWTAGSGSGTAGGADLSQVTQHDVTTHVRIDSIQLFDISSFSALLSKGRDKFPLLPPFVEIPYVGTLLGIPLPAAREYHTSSAVVSAVIVPTATDIAYSIRFVNDRVVFGKQDSACAWQLNAGSPTCTVRRATSLADFGGAPIREFHRMKLQCILAGKGCEAITFSNLLHDDAD